MTNLELKTALTALRLELIALRNRVNALEAKPVVAKTVSETNRKMCPHCGVKPNHFFHVKTCREKNKNNGANKEADG